MPAATVSKAHYRPAVGVAVFNDLGQVWLGKRFGEKGPYSWQQEFSKWKWADLSDAPKLIVPFKRKVYERLVIEFEDYSKPVR